ncbi:MULTISPECIES: hypothetical protein [Streptococcus]|uniref:Uncharacterized protein n=1 Tax=Streptococcus equinus ATCC 9812 TaxID=525379 RepID=E8JR80_STREI|nr:MULTISPECIES: hypothetical protein [Streptococcus]EFW88332.1 hypothetical protein HMPREF0819_1503 [Streptococcus equinus ATCC 9812]MCQ2963050.1 hypothetical protein [Streptococcus sp.]SUN69601.1 hypothetical cytosolic protein [Streptococcus equinus]SUO79188.1 hypothetical cytosolic protein [Streptococcus equinus]VEE21005.1 hypothetical cytosolic protein [Streptococcus equinus]
MSKGFDAFKKTLSHDSLKAVYDETKIEVSESEAEGTEAYSMAVAVQMAVNLLEKYDDWLHEKKDNKK